MSSPSTAPPGRGSRRSRAASPPRSGCRRSTPARCTARSRWPRSRPASTSADGDAVARGRATRRASSSTTGACELDGRDVRDGDPRARGHRRGVAGVVASRGARGARRPPAGVGRGARRGSGRGPRHRHRRVPRRAGQGVPHRERRRAARAVGSATRRRRRAASSVDDVQQALDRPRPGRLDARARDPARGRRARRDRDRHQRRRASTTSSREIGRAGPSRCRRVTLLPVRPRRRAQPVQGGVPGAGRRARSASRATGAYIVAPSHRSILDIPFAAFITDAHGPVPGQGRAVRARRSGRRLFDALGAVEVERGTADRAALRRAGGRAARPGRRWRCSRRAPGSRGPRSRELFDGAAFLAVKLGVPIVPVGIGGSEHILPKGKLFPRIHRVAVSVGRPIQPPVLDGRGPACRGDEAHRGAAASSCSAASTTPSGWRAARPTSAARATSGRVDRGGRR